LRARQRRSPLRLTISKNTLPRLSPPNIWRQRSKLHPPSLPLSSKTPSSLLKMQSMKHLPLLQRSRSRQLRMGTFPFQRPPSQPLRRPRSPNLAPMSSLPPALLATRSTAQLKSSIPQRRPLRSSQRSRLILARRQRTQSRWS